MKSKDALCMFLDTAQHAERHGAVFRTVLHFLRESGIRAELHRYIPGDWDRIQSGGRILTCDELQKEIVSRIRASLNVRPIYLATNFDGFALGVTAAVQGIAPAADIVEILTTCYSEEEMRKSACKRGIEYDRLRHIETSDGGVIRKLREILANEKGILSQNR